MPRTFITRSDVQAMIDASIAPYIARIAALEDAMSQRATTTSPDRASTVQYPQLQSPLVFPGAPVEFFTAQYTLSASGTETLPSPNIPGRIGACYVTMENKAAIGSGIYLTVAPPANVTITGTLASNVLGPQEKQTYLNDSTSTWDQQ